MTGENILIDIFEVLLQFLQGFPLCSVIGKLLEPTDKHIFFIVNEFFRFHDKVLLRIFNPSNARLYSLWDEMHQSFQRLWNGRERGFFP